jgi:hypothetical protein
MLTTTNNLLLRPAPPDRKETGVPAPIIRERIFGIPVDPEVLFADAHNVYRERIEKRQRQLIVKLPFLRSFLHPGEKVILVTTAFSPLRLAAQVLTACLFLDLERSIVIFTNYRLLHVPVGRHNRYRQSIAQIRYRDVRDIVLRRGALEIDYKKGAVEKFKAVAFAERPKIRQLLPALPLTNKGVSPSTRIHLCPQCTRSLIKPVMRCPHCGQAFKGRGRALLATCLTPGGGYLYLRHRRPFVYFSMAEAAAGSVVAWYFWHQGLAGLEYRAVWLAMGAMVVWRGLAWLHAAHLAGEFVPCLSRRRMAPKPGGLLENLRLRIRSARQPA